MILEVAAGVFLGLLARSVFNGILKGVVESVSERREKKNLK